MTNVYLCGPITGTTFDETKYGWRRHVYRELKRNGIIGWSPMRHKMKEQFGKDAQESMHRMGGYPDDPMSCPKGITARDRYDTMKSDLIFCNLLGTEKISVGSMIELGWADAMRIPIVMVMEEGNIHEHAMVEDMLDFRAYSIDEGIDITRKILTPEPM